jgi:meiotic recombination protein DMC1
MEEDEVLPFKELDLLQNHGINGGDINKLKAHGLCTVLSCLMVTKKEMLSIKGITEAKAEKIFEAANKIE